MTNVEKYNLNPKICKHCGKTLPYNKRRNKFCDKSCSASYNNKGVRRNFIKGKSYENKKCLYCGATISREKKYCSTKCQNDYQYLQIINKWKSGEFDGISGDTGTSKHIKRYMLEKNNNKCSICGWSEINPFNGKVHLELHHKDGNFTNNNEENLEILCPNCHSLTKNYKNIGGRKSMRKR